MRKDADDALSKKIDASIKKLMKELDKDTEPLDVKLKLVNAAVNWVKVKHAIEGEEEFDPNA